MASLAASMNLASAAKYSKPVAVFVGGTSGIGQGMAEAFNRHTKGNAHIVLVGRNRDAAETIISKMKSAAGESGTASYEFVSCDVSLISNVKRSAAEIFSRHPKINFLVLSSGFMSTTRSETEEGIDRKLAVQYYGRWSFIHELLPALRSAKEASEDAKVMSVYSAGHGGDIDVTDLGFKKSYSPSVAASGSTYNDLMCEEYAQRNPGIVFAHSYPGNVRTNLLKASDSVLLRASNIFLPLLYPITVSQDECGEYLWSGLYRIAASGAGSAGVRGAYRIGSKGEDLGKMKYFGTPEQRKALWEHTIKETRTADA
ncbi:NAD(P)-binding protein [Rickenella mellea]|uniref:NAD(P)-binding protein n=1 Tax=Rickenella mellea TaxID=50990 RepID=A0A4Y7QHD9_9AGAM|nr:NAD(P)-binding protein [Rickenella mellea]